MKIIFWKDNEISGEHEVSVEQIITDYNNAEISKLDLPFERKILHHMMIEYGSFDKLTDEQWNKIYEAKKELN